MLIGLAGLETPVQTGGRSASKRLIQIPYACGDLRQGQQTIPKTPKPVWISPRGGAAEPPSPRTSEP